MKPSEKEVTEILKAYPKGMSKDQFYKVAHISKATALYLLQSGLVPCNDSGKQTRRYGDRKRYVVEPIALILCEDNYYLMAYSSRHPERTANYRVDRMDQVTVIEDSALSEEALAKLNGISGYTEQAFKMYSGELEDVMLQFNKSLIGPVIDKFGEETEILSVNETTCAAALHIQIAPTFFGWLAQFGSKMKILSSERVKKQYYDHVCEVLNGF